MGMKEQYLSLFVIGLAVTLAGILFNDLGEIHSLLPIAFILVGAVIIIVSFIQLLNS